LSDELEVQQTAQGYAHEQLVAALLEVLTRSTNEQEFTQNWVRIAANIDLLFDTPESIDQLKQTLLQLAVQGKLVPQDPNDEPVSVLLKRIHAEKAKLIAEGKSKKDKPLPQISDDEKSFDLPNGWEWVRLNEIINPLKSISYGVLVPGPDVVSGVPFVRLGDLSITDPPVLPEKSISPQVGAKYVRTRLDGGEILMGVVGSIGKLGIAPSSWKGAKYILVIKCTCTLNVFFGTNRTFKDKF